MTSNPEYETPLSANDKRLMQQAELSASRCVNCGEYGHKGAQCPNPILSPEHLKRRIRVGHRKTQWVWLGVFLTLAAIATGILTAGLWNSLSR
jgi:hypothetical protein